MSLFFLKRNKSEKGKCVNNHKTMADSQTTKLVVYSSISKSGVALVTLNRPNAKNAINPEVAIRLSRLWKTLRDDPNVKVIVNNYKKKTKKK